MDWTIFTVTFWSVVGLWLLPRGVAVVWSAIKAVAS